MNPFLKWPLIVVSILGAGHFLLTGSPIPLIITGSLDHPREVSAIEDDGLLLRGGKFLALPHARLIRDHPAARDDLLRYGVEISPAGGLTGLFRIHHWCGNDPVRAELARVDLLALATLFDCDPRWRASNRRLDPGDRSLLTCPPEEIRRGFDQRHGP